MPKSPTTYRELSAELDDILQQLESSELDIETAMNLYKRGMLIVRQLEKHLETAENTVKKIKLQFEK